MANKTVEEIVEKAKSGDMSAFDLLYREYSEKLLKYVIKLGADRNDAEDIVSDSFVEAIEHICDLKNNAFFSTWLHTIAKNKVYTMKKKEQKHARVDFTSDDGDEQNDGLDVAAAKAAEYNGDTIMLPEDYAENEEVKQILADTINSLNSDQRDAIYLFYYKNNSISEIAEQAGVSENTIKSRLSLARKYMERKLKKLQKNGVVLCAVPIPVILNIVVSESKLKAAAPVVTTAAGGATSGAAVSAVSGKIGALIAAGIIIGGGVGIYSTLSDRSGNIHKGDIRTADSSSVRISDASSIDSRKDWDPDLIKVVDTDTVESTIAVDDVSSQTDSRPTNTNQGNTRTTQPNQQAQPAQPAQQVIEYYDEGTANNAEYEGDTGNTENRSNFSGDSNGNSSGNNTNDNSTTQNNSNWVSLDPSSYSVYNFHASSATQDMLNYIKTSDIAFNDDTHQISISFVPVFTSISNSPVTEMVIEVLPIDENGEEYYADISTSDISYQDGIYKAIFDISNYNIHSRANNVTITSFTVDGLSYPIERNCSTDEFDMYGVYSVCLSDTDYYCQRLLLDSNGSTRIRKDVKQVYYQPNSFGQPNSSMNCAYERLPEDGRVWTQCIFPNRDIRKWVKKIEVENGNPFFEVIDGVLYYKANGKRRLIWTPEYIVAEKFVFPDNIEAVDLRSLTYIIAGEFDFGNNTWMKTNDSVLNALGLKD